MPELYLGKIPIINRSLNDGFIRGDAPEGLSTGCIPRDFDIDPVAMADSPDGMKLTLESELDAIYDEDMKNEATLLHMYLRGVENGGKPAFQFLDQNGFPDCWFHSSTHAMMADRMKQGLEPVRFNAVAGATLLNQLNGGWCGLSMKFLREHGCPVIGTGPGEWPYHSRKGRDVRELRENMARFKATEDWYDLGRKEWDQHLAKQQLWTCGLNLVPCPVDYNEYGHSMLQLLWARSERGRWGSVILNSWAGFGYHGLCFIPWDVARPDNAVALRASTSTWR